MRLGFLFLLTAIFPLHLFATHTFGGYISYKTQGNLSYEFTVTLIVDINSPGNLRNTIPIDYGDQSGIDTLLRDSLFQFRNNVYIARFKGTHNYTGHGSFTVSITDPNRFSGISNASNTSSQALYLETSLNTLWPNNSIKLFEPAHYFVRSDSTLDQTINLLAFDEDGDQLIYELIDSKRANNLVLSNYQKPSTATINKRSGSLHWSPIGIGFYLFTVKISEVRNSQIVSYTTVDFIVESDPQNYKHPSFVTGSFLSKDSCGVYSNTFQAGDTIRFFLNVLQKDTAHTSSPYYPINCFSGLDTTRSFCSFIYLGFNRYEIYFRWFTDSSDARCAPYPIYFRANEQYETEDFVYHVYVLDSSSTHCDTICDPTITSVDEIKSSPFSFEVYPNPTSNILNIDLGKNTLEGKLRLELINLHGQTIETRLFDSSSHGIRLRLQKLPTGIYFIRLMDEGDFISEKKILIIK